MSSDSFDIDELAEEYLESQVEQGNEIVTAEEREKNDEGLRPHSLKEALDKHREIQRENNRSQNTIDSHRSRLRKFAAWLRINGVDDTTDIERHHFQSYRSQRSENVKTITVKTHMDSIRVWMRNLEEVSAVPDNHYEFVRSPSLEGDEGQRSDHLPVERGDRILENVRKYQWGSMEHVIYELWWASGVRLGGVHSLDEGDYHPDAPAVELEHRPETDTTLKNGNDGERWLGISPTTAEAIEDYIDNPERPNTTDQHGRQPLITSPRGGRYSKSQLRNICYSLTLPCMTEGHCPHDKNPETCDWNGAVDRATYCDSSKAPHALRSGALTRQMKRGIDPRKISERANVGLDTLEDHYNEMTEREKMELRREVFDDEYAQSSKEELEERLFDRE
jgi:site-specific recombinase XerD